jgi:hypothetical protein
VEVLARSHLPALGNIPPILSSLTLAGGYDTLVMTRVGAFDTIMGGLGQFIFNLKMRQLVSRIDNSWPGVSWVDLASLAKASVRLLSPAASQTAT